MISPKTIAKAGLALVARSDVACHALLPALRELERHQQANDQAFVEGAARLAFPDCTVRHGPCAGLVYPATDHTGHTIFPKLLGSYERELHDVVEQAVKNGPSAVVNIGCGEGYYTVGLALRIPTATVFAFDINPAARDACAQMALLNHVSEQVHVEEHCTADDLVRLPRGGHALIIIDCEGHERWLFSDDALSAVRRHHLIIEIHDFVQPDTGALLASRLAETHTVTSISAVEDSDKPSTYPYDELRAFADHHHQHLLAERRPRGMYWLCCSPKRLEAQACLPWPPWSRGTAAAAERLPAGLEMTDLTSSTEPRSCDAS